MCKKGMFGFNIKSFNLSTIRVFGIPETLNNNSNFKVNISNSPVLAYPRPGIKLMNKCIQ